MNTQAHKGVSLKHKGKTKAGNDYEISLSVESVTITMNGSEIPIDPLPVMERIMDSTVAELEGKNPPPMYPVSDK